MMRPIHPFPARMAPETISAMLNALPKGARVLDPMCGSGVVLRQAGCLGHTAVGVDVDPLAVLMSRVWTSNVDSRDVIAALQDVLRRARKSRVTPGGLEHLKGCSETLSFISYWFAEPQRNYLARISRAIAELNCGTLTREVLQLALSRIIVTKQVGASLAWDVSHSRPHRVRTENDYDVAKGFESSVMAILTRMTSEVTGDVTVSRGDCRSLTRFESEKFDAIITSPPYLNAIDYLRGHKLALVWLGYTIPELRKIRAGSIGTEKSGSTNHSRISDYHCLSELVSGVSNLPRRQRSIVNKYAYDASDMIMEMRRLIAPDGTLVLVLADSVVRGVDVPSSKIFSGIANSFGFKTVAKSVREIPSTRRYLPIAGQTSPLAHRMRYETVETFKVIS